MVKLKFIFKPLNWAVGFSINPPQRRFICRILCFGFYIQFGNYTPTQTESLQLALTAAYKRINILVRANQDNPNAKAISWNKLPKFRVVTNGTQYIVLERNFLIWRPWRNMYKGIMRYDKPEHARAAIECHIKLLYPYRLLVHEE